MDKDYLSAQIAEALGNAQGIVETEHKLLNDKGLVFGMKRQLQDIHSDDEEQVSNIERVLDRVGRTPDTQKWIERGRALCSRIIDMPDDDPLEILRATILAKYKLADSMEFLYGLCDEIGQDDICEVFETNLEEEEDHLDYLREQAMLIARERATGISATK